MVLNAKGIWRTAVFYLGICIILSISGTVVFAQSLIFNTQEFPPFSYGIDGRVSGPVAEIIETACKKSQLTCSFRLLPWTRAQKEVVVGKGPCTFRYRQEQGKGGLALFFSTDFKNRVWFFC